MARYAGLLILVLAALESSRADERSVDSVTVTAPNLTATLDPKDGRIHAVDSLSKDARFSWLHAPTTIRVRNEATAVTGIPKLTAIQRSEKQVTVRGGIPELEIETTEVWSEANGGLAWDLELRGVGEPVGHEITIELPALSRERIVFTPSERGTVSLDAHPTLASEAYGTVGWSTGRCYGLPLVGVLDPEADRGFTIALPPEPPVSDFRVSWHDAAVLELRFGHRAAGEGAPARLRLLFGSHRADYRSSIRFYSDAFPRYFRPVLPRGSFEGAFWYHHIHDHPDFEEMARQDVRFTWASFWFTHLGEYLPAEEEWKPYTYARWWTLSETMSDAKIRSFVRELHERGIGTFAYFNVTEYGGAGGETGNAEEAAQILRERFADALILRENGSAIPTWEGAVAMNPSPRYSLFPFLREQVRRHLDRLPEIDGFCVDRLDWASVLDYGHSDGRTRLGERAVEDLAGPVSDALEMVCRLTHDAGKRVYVNQFYRVEVLKDVDGYCHENDYVRGLGYLAPYRPASAWHHRVPYAGDLLRFEAQLKLRLQFAIFPQMIAHEFPISQQAPDPEAADLLELFAPLFAPLRGSDQVLEPHCVAVSGPHDANLFRDASGRYVAPVTSRVRFLSRGGGPPGRVELRLEVPDCDDLRWARVTPLGGAPYDVEVLREGGTARVVLDRHETSSVVVVGAGQRSEGGASESSRLATLRERRFPRSPSAAPSEVQPPVLTEVDRWLLVVEGELVEEGGEVQVHIGERTVGTIRPGDRRLAAPFEIDAARVDSVEVRLRRGSEGAWFVPERVRLLAARSDGRTTMVGRWTLPDGVLGMSTPSELIVQIPWCEPEDVEPSTATFVSKDDSSAGGWRGRYGRTAAWIPPLVKEDESTGFRLEVRQARSHVWDAATEDSRALEPPKAACWFDDSRVVLSVTPSDGRPYRLTVYLLDYDRNGRAETCRLTGDWGDLDARDVSRSETDRGVYLSWTVQGAVTVEVEKREGHNAVVSGVFVDPE